MMESNNALEKNNFGNRCAPGVSQTALQVLKLANDSDAGIRDIVGVILYDQAITSDCLRLCNASFFGLMDKVESIHRAMILPGASQLINFCRLAGELKAR